MARKTLQERRAAALADMETAKKRLAQLETEAAERIGRLAVKAGLVDLDITDEQLSSEFDAVASRFRDRSKIGNIQGKAASGEG